MSDNRTSDHVLVPWRLLSDSLEPIGDAIAECRQQVKLYEGYPERQKRWQRVLDEYTLTKQRIEKIVEGLK